jgi:hypothetical protein
MVRDLPAVVLSLLDSHLQVENFPLELIDAVAAECSQSVLANLALVSQTLQTVAERRLYSSVRIPAPANTLQASGVLRRLVETLADSPQRAGYVRFCVVKFGSKEVVRDAASPVQPLAISGGRGLGMTQIRLGRMPWSVGGQAVSKRRGGGHRQSWDGTELVLKALENMCLLTDLRVTLGNGGARLIERISRIIRLVSLSLSPGLELFVILTVFHSSFSVTPPTSSSRLSSAIAALTWRRSSKPIGAPSKSWS